MCVHSWQPVRASETRRLPPVPSIGVGQRLGLLRVQDCFKSFRVWSAPRPRTKNSQIHLACIVFRGRTMQMQMRRCFPECGGQVGAAFENASAHSVCSLPLPGFNCRRARGTSVALTEISDNNQQSGVT